MLIITGLATVIAASIIIMYACNSFEDASDYLGRKMPDGIKGATINAIGSSMPELFTTTFLLFLFHDMDGFSAGIATCAGSAVFNAVIIPGLSILAVLIFGVTINGIKKKVSFIEVSKGTIIRDGLFFLAAEITLILFLGGTKMFWWMGGTLLSLYALYFAYLMYQMKTDSEDDEATRDTLLLESDIDKTLMKIKDTELDEYEVTIEEETSFFIALRTLDFNTLFFKGKELNNNRAWVVLAIAVSFIGGSCYFLAEATMQLAEGFNIPPFVAAVIFAAAATSVPDTILSVKDALKGNYDDAISNAVGSNIFDITVCLGLPLLAYGLIYGDVVLSANQWGSAGVQELRIGLVVITIAVLALLLIGKKLGKAKAGILFSLYGLWLIYILGFQA